MLKDHAALRTVLLDSVESVVEQLAYPIIPSEIMAMTTHASHQPTGYPTVSVYMMADGAQRVIDFVRDVLDGETVMRLDRDNGTILHAAVRIGDSVIMLSDGTPEAPAFPVWLHVYVRDVDETYQRALDYGAGSVQTPSEQGDGDRRGGIRDPAGNTWWIATHLGR